MRKTELAPARPSGLAPFVLLALTFGAPPPAAADLSQSTLTLSPKAPVEGDLIRYELRVRNASAADMARRDHAILNEWTETPATVLSRRLDASSASSTSSGSTSSGRIRPRTRPALPGRRRHHPVNRLRLGLRSAPGWSRGTGEGTGDPRDVVVKRGYGGAYLFALLGLPAFLLGFWLILRLTRPRPSTDEDTEDTGGILPPETTR